MKNTQNVSFQIVKLSPMVKKLIIINVALWVVLQIIFEKLILGSGLHDIGPVVAYLGLTPKLIMEHGYIWQFVTYMFLHALGIWHIFFNMLSLWFFGCELEYRWGKNFFLAYYMVSGVGAGLIYMIVYALVGLAMDGPMRGYSTPVIGASGSVFGILLAYGMLFGDRVIYFFGIFPMKARYFVMIYGAMEFFILLTNGIGGANNVANLAHLGGLFSGLFFLWGWTRYKQSGWRSQKSSSKSRRNLRLVVNKDDKDKDDGPQYWN